MKKYLFPIMIGITSLSAIGAYAGSGVGPTTTPVSASYLGTPAQKLTLFDHRKVVLISQKAGMTGARLCQYASEQECYSKDPKCSLGQPQNYGCAVCSDGISWKCVPL
ncbi:hypothetical protein ABE562_04260 [Brucella intermedia]|uniref:Uncharacterized protein n=2 Tax=Brucella intermedia TaxID=94625 RepID=U4VA27_9HYPH|nr:hypothetical protein [Brucella intermedia]ERM01519.1 hypothetical protein Q644_21155 [Brucella intermedia 229E]EEQ95566.1 Hypothetical protein OINT_1000949 [Brucella intermedia LMG 3301]MCB4918129.1 hypothetical protein [Brucella intermedia]OOC49395.1 hypothetical protein AS855_20265 [Brucella intermedia M86]SUB12536.1 Uncharacterised protein [Brucella intermedia]